jgi:urease accessory protein
MADATALLRLLTWMSPAFPTGGFAYSHGLEWSVEAGDVTNEAALIGWCQDMVTHGSLWQDVILLRHAYRAAPEELAALVVLAVALAPSAERLLESIAQGTAFALASASWPVPLLANWGDEPLPYPIAVGVLAAGQQIGEDDVALAYLHAGTANFISAAVRLIPLGQMAGLRAQAALEPYCLRAAQLTAHATLDDIGTASWGADIASMNHETQHTRLFRS